MARAFNCGVGMLVAVSADAAGAVKELLQAEGETVYEIGSLREKVGDEVDKEGCVLTGLESWD